MQAIEKLKYRSDGMVCDKRVYTGLNRSEAADIVYEATKQYSYDYWDELVVIDEEDNKKLFKIHLKEMRK